MEWNNMPICETWRLSAEDFIALTRYIAGN